VIFLYNGMLYGLFPLEEGVSWESHLTGAVIGFMSAYYFKDSQAGILPNNFNKNTPETNDRREDIPDHTHSDSDVKIVYHFKPGRKE
jgi:hypothetical protein